MTDSNSNGTFRMVIDARLMMLREDIVAIEANEIDERRNCARK